MKSDIPIKRVLQVRPMDWVRFLLPDMEELNVTELETEFIPKTKSQLDKLLFVNEDFFLHIEPNGYLDKALPARMLRYRADIWEHTMNQNMGTPSINQVLILFYEKHDNKQHELLDKTNGDESLKYKYRVIRVWEMSKTTVIDQKLTGLYPLLPLMRQEENETPDTVLQNAVEVIGTVQDDALKHDLMSALSMLAEERYSKVLVRKYIRREMFMRSELFEEYAKEYAEEYAKEYAEEYAKEELKKAKIEIARNLLTLELDIEKILEITGLQPDDLLSLREKV